jgi:autotransporter-associated beta strand protein
MKLKLSVFALAAASLGSSLGQTSFTSTSVTTAWNASRWNNSTDAAPYTSTFMANNPVNFTSGNYSFAGMGATINVGNINVASGANVNFASIGSTFATNGAVRTITVASGSTFDFQGQSISTAAGTGLIKSGDGVFGTGAGAFTGGFTLNGGTVIARGTTGMGSGATNVLTLNGGTVASNANRDFADTRFGGGIVIGGNVQFGELDTVVSIASSTANLSFANNVGLGSATRTFTQGNNGTNTFSGIISNTSGGLTFAANVGTNGRFEITNASNTFTGDINVNGGEVRFTTDGSMGNADNDIIIDGGRLAKANDATTVTLGSGRTISVGDGAGTSISSPGSGILIYNGAIANKSGETGAWAKQGGGALELGGASSYTGSTAINNGILRLTIDNDRLPIGTVVSLGQAASANLGTLDLNGRNQTIAGLVSTSGLNAIVGSTNVVTSASASTLTINAATSTTHVYSTGTAADSGIISGSISLVKGGEGTQVLGGLNTYSGTTTINLGTLLVEGSHTGGGTYTIGMNGTLGGDGTIASSIDFLAGSSFQFNLTDTLTVNGSNVFFDGFGVANLVGLDSSVAEGTYTLMDGSATFDFAGLTNFGEANKASIGGGKFAYFAPGSLDLIVAIPEPSTTILGGLGLLALFRRRRSN